MQWMHLSIHAKYDRWETSFELMKILFSKDFYQFACGNWDKSHPIPEGRNVRSSFETFVNDAVDLYRGNWRKIFSTRIDFLLELLRKPVLDLEPDAVRKLKMFYQTCTGTGKKYACSKEKIWEMLLFIKRTRFSDKWKYHISFTSSTFGTFRWISSVICQSMAIEIILGTTSG